MKAKHHPDIFESRIAAQKKIAENAEKDLAGNFRDFREDPWAYFFHSDRNAEREKAKRKTFFSHLFHEADVHSAFSSLTSGIVDRAADKFSEIVKNLMKKKSE